MFYFKDERALQSEGKIVSAKVAEFRERVRIYVLDKTFVDADGLERLIREDLAQVIMNWETRATAQPKVDNDSA